MRFLNIAALFLLGFSLPCLANQRLPSPAPNQPVTQSNAQEASPARPLPAPPSTRGQLLYENHCMSCHESLVHIRAGTLVSSLAALRMQVVRWAVISKLRWNAEEIEDVVTYLNAQFYQFNK